MGYSKLQSVAGCWHREISTTDAVDHVGAHAAASLGGLVTVQEVLYRETWQS